MVDLSEKLAFVLINLEAISADIENSAITGLPDDKNDRYQKVMGWAMAVKAYAKFLDKIKTDTQLKGQ